MRTLPFSWTQAAEHVARQDTKMARVIQRARHRVLDAGTTRSPMEALARAIIYQQLTGKAAGTIHARVCSLFPRGRISAAALLALTDAQLRACGVSGPKQRALRDLAHKVAGGQVPGFAQLGRMEDQAIIALLTTVRGIGRWTAEMLLIFELNRPDVLPVADLGIRKGLALAHGLKTLPSEERVTRLAEAWRPYRTVGSWFCWRALDT